MSSFKQANLTCLGKTLHVEEQIRTSRPGAISTKTPYGAIDLIGQFLINEAKKKKSIKFINSIISNAAILKKDNQSPKNANG